MCRGLLGGGLTNLIQNSSVGGVFIIWNTWLNFLKMYSLILFPSSKIKCPRVLIEHDAQPLNRNLTSVRFRLLTCV